MKSLLAFATLSTALAGSAFADVGPKCSVSAGSSSPGWL